MSEMPNETSLPKVAEPPVKVSYFHWQTLLLAFIILMCGVVIGGGCTAVVIRNRVLYAIEHPEEGPARTAERLKRQLRLSEDQRQRVEHVLTERSGAFRAIYRDNLPRIAVELQRTNQEIGTILNDRQRADWDKRFSRLERIALGSQANGSPP
jgi:hypothetical protein